MEGLASRLETCVSREKQEINLTGAKSYKRKLNECNEIVLNPCQDRKKVENLPRDETLQWQQEITTGFDRLVALASEVDKRRRSDDSPPVKMATVTPMEQQQTEQCSRGQPGDKLPERHFKKKYFDQEFQKRQQQNQSKGSLQ